MLKIEHQFEPVLDDAADLSAGRTGPHGMGRAGAELFADRAEAGFDVFIEHAVAQQLIVPYLKQLYVRLKIAVGCEDNGCLPIHQSHFGVGIPDA